TDATSEADVPPNANPSAATATRPPSRAAALFTPDAEPPRSQGAASKTTVVSGATHAVMPIPVNTRPGRRARHRAQQRRGARGLPRGTLVGVDVRDRKLAQVIVIACRPPDADVVVRADVGAEAERPPDGTHVRSLHQLGALLVAKVSFEPDGALEGVAAAIRAMVVRQGYLGVGKRDFPLSRRQPYRHRRARGERSAQQLVGVRPRRRAAPAVGAADRERRCAGTAIKRASAVKVAGHLSLWAGSAIVVRIRHRAFHSDLALLAPG